MCWALLPPGLPSLTPPVPRLSAFYLLCLSPAGRRLVFDVGSPRPISRTAGTGPVSLLTGSDRARGPPSTQHRGGSGGAQALGGAEQLLLR